MTGGAFFKYLMKIYVGIEGKLNTHRNILFIIVFLNKTLSSLGPNLTMSNTKKIKKNSLSSESYIYEETGKCFTQFSILEQTG